MVVEEMKPAPKSWVVPVAVAAACGIGFVVSMAPARDAGEAAAPAPDTRATDRVRARSLEAVVAQVAVESRNGPRTPRIEEAPQRVPMPNPGAPRLDTAARSPPDGFTFVEHHGETATERFRPPRDAGGTSPHDSPDWLRTPGSVSRLVGQAAGTWADVEGTETTGEVCAHSPAGTGQYRLVVEMDIDGEAGRYASNVIDHVAE